MRHEVRDGEDHPRQRTHRHHRPLTASTERIHECTVHLTAVSASAGVCKSVRWMKNYFLCIRDSVRRLDPEHVPHAIRPLREVGHLVQHVHNLLHAAALAVALRDLPLPAPTRDAEMRPEKTMRSDRALPHRSAIAAVSASPKASSDTPLESRNSPVNPSNNAQNSRWSASCSTAEPLLGLRLARVERRKQELCCCAYR